MGKARGQNRVAGGARTQAKVEKGYRRSQAK